MLVEDLLCILCSSLAAFMCKKTLTVTMDLCLESVNTQSM